ncbi:MAG: chromosomal replication initiator protein DnaA [Hyphomicrobium sp.]|nr:chromosomal replication initiator protein DnaA [Hyphomicrobium sp.]
MNAILKADAADAARQGAVVSADAAHAAVDGRGQKVRAMLKARLGEEIYSSWFKSMEFESFDGRLVRVSVPVKFVRNWIHEHYSDHLLQSARIEFAGAERIEVVWRQPGSVSNRAPEARPAPQAEAPTPSHAPSDALARSVVMRPVMPAAQRTSGGGLEGSPLDPRYTFESFVVGAANRMAHAGAIQVAETVLTDSPGYNPLYIHSSVGLGKSHLLQAIAWEVKRRNPNAQVLYLTAERFRYQFVEALRSSDPLAFKERFRNISLLLIDDLEFLQGERTEQEFDHIINALLDGGKQVVVASARAPNHIERLNERMRSRLQRGLVTELQPLDHELRQKVVEKRVAEKRAQDQSFNLSRDVQELLASRLTENGRELEGAVTRLFATWQYMRTPITMDIAETVIRDLVANLEPRRIKIEDILRIISRHYGVSKGDLLSQRRHRSVVWPRQIGMYLAKQLTARSLPEIGRRFGGRDHTTVLHAIRKIEGEITKNPRLEGELEELKKLLNH